MSGHWSGCAPVNAALQHSGTVGQSAEEGYGRGDKKKRARPPGPPRAQRRRRSGLPHGRGALRAFARCRCHCQPGQTPYPPPRGQRPAVLISGCRPPVHDWGGGVVDGARPPEQLPRRGCMVVVAVVVRGHEPAPYPRRRQLSLSPVPSVGGDWQRGGNRLFAPRPRTRRGFLPTVGGTCPRRAPSSLCACCGDPEPTTARTPHQDRPTTHTIRITHY